MKDGIILFDFDGVIADSFAAAFEVQKLICPNITEDDYRKGFEGNINDWQRETVNHSDDCRHDLDWFAEYVPRMKKSVGIISGMSEVIGDLSKKYKLFVVSSTITSPIREFMEKYEISSYFAEIMGNDVHASKVEKIKMVMEKEKAGAGDCVFITDTLGDMLEAESAGIGAIGVSWGFQKHETLARGKPFKVVDKPQDLPPAVAEYFAQNF